MARIDEELLDQKLAVLERARPWSPRTVAKLEALLHSEDDAALLRMNPFSFARERGVAPDEALDLFLHAAHAGIVTMEWHLLCPNCGASVESFASLRKLHRQLFCALCDVRADANLDDFIQVGFTVAPTLRRLAFHDLTSLPAEDFLYKTRFTREMRFGGPDGPRMADAMRGFIKIVTWVQPGERRDFVFEGQDGTCSAAELQSHAGAMFTLDPAATASRVELVIDETSVVASAEQVRPGHVDLGVENQRAAPVVFVLAHKPAAVLGGPLPPTHLEPFLTGAQLLTNQTFRRLFRGETVGGAEGIGVRDVAVLFTDLKGSTALYERIGDLRAFSLVQQHFERLALAVGRNGGAIVKTIGDAVMAAFQRPADAVRAAVDMQAQIDRFNLEQGARDIVLKIGIHRGPSIAVTLNENLDYFGHTVNVAARVQGLADANEIFVTDEVYRADGVAPLLACLDSHDAQLKGIQRLVKVHRTVAAGAASP